MVLCRKCGSLVKNPGTDEAYCTYCGKQIGDR